MKTSARHLVLLLTTAVALLATIACSSDDSSGDSDATTAPQAAITPSHSSVDIYSAIVDSGECDDEQETIFVPSWSDEEQVWESPCNNSDADKSRCLLIEDDTLEVESKDLEGSECRQGPEG